MQLDIQTLTKNTIILTSMKYSYQKATGTASNTRQVKEVNFVQLQ